MSSQYDRDFDGKLETSVYYVNGTAVKLVTDSNNDELFDIIFTLKFGELIAAEKYYAGNQTGPSKIGKVEFGYPISGEKVRVAEISNRVFSAIAWEEPEQ